jgi:hypothetical protein
MPGWPVPQERLISGPPKVPHELGRFDCEVTGHHGKLQRRKLTDGVPPVLSRGDSSDEVQQEAAGVVDPGDDPARPPG